jgi:hypothetical protein
VVEWYKQEKTPDSSTTNLWKFYQKNHLVAKQRNLQSKLIMPSKYLFYTSNGSLRAVKPYDMGPPALLPLWRKVCYGFLSPLKIHRPRPGLDPRILGPITNNLSTYFPEHTSICVLFAQFIIFLQVTSSLIQSHFLLRKLKAKTVPVHATNAVGGRGGIAPTHSRPQHQMGWVVGVTPRSRFSLGERTPDTHWTRGWVGPRAGLDTRG